MASTHRESSSFPPITAFRINDDNDGEELETDGTVTTDNESEQDSDDVAEQLMTFRHRAKRTPRDGISATALITNPGFSRVRSWQRVPVPEGRADELAKVKLEFKLWLMEVLPSAEPWSLQNKEQRRTFLQEGMVKWPVMQCYEDGWPLEAMARQALIERRADANGTRSRKRRSSTTSRVSTGTTRSSRLTRSSKKAQTAPIVEEATVDDGSDTNRTGTDASNAAGVDELVTRRDREPVPSGSDNDFAQEMVSLIGQDARALASRFAAAGICTVQAVQTFAQWSNHEQRRFLKEDVGLTPYEAMEIVHRIAL